MEQRIGPLTFFSNFDSGNLAKVERKQEDENTDEESSASVPSLAVPDFEYNVWTWPDAVGTEFENLNRTWFHFGVKGGSPGKLLKINIMNLNRQGKLYSQGMSPFIKVVPGRNKWERIRERPTYETVDGQFILSFTYRFPEQKNSVHYFAFCYPYSYLELQTHLDGLDKVYDSCKAMTPSSPSNSIYFYRELLCKSLDNLRMDLLTITSCKGMTEEKETRLDKLFPDLDTPRAHKFKGKKVYFLSARVHPGETPSSFVFNGFLDFILRPDDPRAAALRDQYVFKLVPMLNPDGVKRGHYRTDSRGVNLNRVYLDPDPGLHPTIYAAKSIVLYHHNKMDHQIMKRTCSCGGKTVKNSTNTLTSLANSLSLDDASTKDRISTEGEENMKTTKPIPCDNITALSAGSPEFGYNETKSSTNTNVDIKMLGNTGDLIEKTNLDDTSDNKQEQEYKTQDVKTNESPEVPQNNLDRSKRLTEDGSKRTGDLACNCLTEDGLKRTGDLACNCLTEDGSKRTGNLACNCLTEDGSKRTGDLACNCLTEDGSKRTGDLACNCLTEDGSMRTGDLAFYVDLHGHASKRGCFVYANFMDNEEDYVQSILYPKLMSINSANFDFTGCNFTEKNMYTKDKRDGMSKEGSGRVAIFKATSIIHSYTLECNYNSGRMLNPVPPATCDNGRATPPPPPGFPPKFTTEIYEEVGRALAVAVLDMNNSNPWSRLPTSEFSSVEGVKNWVMRFVKSAKNAPAVPRKLSRAATKTSSIVAGATATTRQKVCSTFKSTSSSELSGETLSAAAQKVTERMTQNIKAASKKVLDEPRASKRIIAAPRRLSQTISGLSTNRTTVNRKMSSGCNTESLSLANGTLRTQAPKNKDQPRVSLDLPITGPALRIPKPNQLLSASIKALSCPADLRTGRSTQVEVLNQFVGIQPRKTTAARPGGGSASDEEKRKQLFLNKKKNGRKKLGKPDDLINGLPPCTTDARAQKSSEGDATIGKKVVGVVKRDRSSGSLLHRSNSRKSKKIIKNNLNSCEVVDITELPQSSSQPMAYWVDA